MIKTILITLVAFSVSLAQAADESVLFQPGLSLYSDASQLTDLFGPNGSQLCAPVAITHGMNYLKWGWAPGYTELKSVGDVDQDGVENTYKDQIRYFAKSCNTDATNGTYLSEVNSCVKKYITDSGYKPYVYTIGAHSMDSIEGYPAETLQHNVNIEDVRTYTANGLMVIMLIGWWDYNAVTNSYTRQGGHFFNVYGYDWNYGWNQDQITLKVVNSWVDYSNRPREEMFDDVQMTLVTDPNHPTTINYELTGTGFNYTQHAFVEDLVVALPIQ